ncbi:MAG: DNA/pantothenate metabolism flavoprotein domain protein [Verrucomicrobia bacterium]|nr:DNA/pantothenate metabolism flavoprotein domain protein [Verrucomicrobiota bacterium]
MRTVPGGSRRTCIVTAGPTHEAVDEVRRLTNLSTGRLGIGLAAHLADCGHEVTLLVGEQATWAGERRAHRVQVFGSAADLSLRLEALRNCPPDAVFHAAAVSDFRVGAVWAHHSDGQLVELRARKISSGENRLLVELLPTLKIIAELRGWFPRAQLTGWKYEVDGSRADALRRGAEQVAGCHTDACVVNGPAYGAGFGLVGPAGRPLHLEGAPALYSALERRLARRTED